MKLSLVKLVAVLALFCGSPTLFAQAQSVGRVDVKFSSPAWKSVTLDDKGQAYSGEVSGVIQSQTKAFVHLSEEGAVQAVLLLRASAGGIGNGYFTYSPNCKNNDATFAEGNQGFQMPFVQCLLVFPVFTTSSLMRDFPVDQQAYFKQYGDKLPHAMRSYIVNYSNQNGTFVSATVLLASSFTGQRNAENSQQEDPYLIWGRLLMQQVRGSVNSISAELSFPPLEFKLDKPV